MTASNSALNSALNSVSILTSASLVDQAITTRHSIRAFLDRPVELSMVEDILEVAARAPSGTNTQPWRVYVVAGAEKEAICNKVLSVFNQPEQAAQAKEGYSYYPEKWVSPFVDRRRKVGWDLYSLLDIGKADKAKMHAQHARNYKLFDAPVGLFFTINSIMGQGSWLDYGMFLQNIMVAARGRGLDTCPQAAWNSFHRTIAAHFAFGQDEVFVCGMALGYADPDAIENTLITERESVANFASFRGF
jgi:nitroreductase